MSRRVARNPRGRCSLGSAARMAYRVEIARNAQADLEDLYLWGVRVPLITVPSGSMVSRRQSSRWTNIRSAVTREPRPHQPVRVLSYGRRAHVYRIFFTVLVRVVHVRRGARQRPVVDKLRGD